jgi:hypothetical protein
MSSILSMSLGEGKKANMLVLYKISDEKQVTTRINRSLKTVKIQSNMYQLKWKYWKGERKLFCMFNIKCSREKTVLHV